MKDESVREKPKAKIKYFIKAKLENHGKDLMKHK